MHFVTPICNKQSKMLFINFSFKSILINLFFFNESHRSKNVMHNFTSRWWCRKQQQQHGVRDDAARRDVMMPRRSSAFESGG